ncbi:uncharacterized protein ATNIH1004_007753 [Aspergillus tanneri]|uniref:Major facilitator superfamily (MFS) profile domain-containing protein n=1 Tax=Aspergillus tanneri TaxID=1220188 RepID=A0A5M9MKA5_9EURO|nr:uncharacterized protein ATNIH1004_007753 [Aspergillus tanneri]KAA8646326.1 hypothetical protein ATNIH1004_007753 [Aspergillus tanneri]
MFVSAALSAVGYQIIAGSSTGFTSQIAVMANTASNWWIILVSAAQSVFGNMLIRRIQETVSGLSPSAVIGAGASALRKTFTAEQLPGVLTAYTDGLTGAFAVATALLVISAPLALLARWEKFKAGGTTAIGHRRGG